MFWPSVPHSLRSVSVLRTPYSRAASRKIPIALKVHFAAQSVITLIPTVTHYLATLRQSDFEHHHVAPFIVANLRRRVGVDLVSIR